MDQALANDRARALWGTQTVGGRRARSAVGSPDYFEQLRAYRYGYEAPYIPRLFRFHELAGKKVLEVGVGTGIDAIEMARSGADYSGVDVCRNHLDLTRQHFALHPELSPPKLTESDVLTFSPHKKFDVVYSFGVLHHVHHERESLEQIWRLLAPGGRLRVALYANYSFFNAYLWATWLAKGMFLRCSFSEWQSHLSEGSPLKEPVVIRVRSKREIVSLYEGAGFKLKDYHKRGFVQNYLPLIGKLLHPDGAVLNMLGAALGWYHVCDFVKVE